MKVLYLGTSPENYEGEGEVIHAPLISIQPRALNLFSITTAFADLPDYTHIIFTSKNTAPLFQNALAHFGYTSSDLHGKTIIAVGDITALALERCGISADLIAHQSTQEGIASLISTLPLKDPYLFLPGSSKARPYLLHYLALCGIRHQSCHLYDPISELRLPPHDLSTINRIVFTSPSTVEAFFSLYSSIPPHIHLEAIGPITQLALDSY